MQSLHPIIYLFTFMYHFRIDHGQGKYPYSYVFFNMQGSNMLPCNLSIQFFFHFYVSFSHRLWSKVSIHTFLSFWTCKEVIGLYAISLYNFIYLFFHFYVSFSHRPWSKVSIRTFMSFSTYKEVICFYAISLSIFFFFS